MIYEAVDSLAAELDAFTDALAESASRPASGGVMIPAFGTLEAVVRAADAIQ